VKVDLTVLTERSAEVKLPLTMRPDAQFGSVPTCINTEDMIAEGDQTAHHPVGLGLTQKYAMTGRFHIRRYALVTGFLINCKAH
jgi:hypothetical protein